MGRKERRMSWGLDTEWVRRLNLTRLDWSTVRGSDAEPSGGESSAEQAEGGLLSWVLMVSGALSPFEGNGIRDMPDLHFSQRGGWGLTPSSAAPASQPAPSEPRHSTTRDVGSSNSDSGSASDSDSQAEEASESEVDGPAHSVGGLADRGNKLSLFAPRK